MDAMPALILGITVSTYWACVGAMMIRVSRRQRRLGREVVPAQGRERLMWLIWVPVIAAWIAMPFLAPAQNPELHPWIALPAVASSHSLLLAFRMGAAGVSLICLLVSIRCWRHMGKHWRMANDLSGDAKLLTDGPFALVRHPIYTVSITLMVCSVAIIPTPVMLILAVIHVTLMQLKARSEETFLLEKHGEVYREYCGRTGRFLPRIRPSG